jgi:phosphoribosylformylglycinamidine (FGAM) synthase-like amidotransferase family enzyme
MKESSTDHFEQIIIADVLFIMTLVFNKRVNITDSWLAIGLCYGCTILVLKLLILQDSNVMYKNVRT